MANLQDIVNRSEVGAIKPWTAAAAPDGYLLCNGAAVSRTTYADLFAVIGTTYGAGDSSTTFNVPQLQGKMPQGYDGNTYNLAGTGGANTVTVAVTNNQAATNATNQSVTITGAISNTSLTTAQLASHQHTIQVANATGNPNPKRSFNPSNAKQVGQAYSNTQDFWNEADGIKGLGDNNPIQNAGSGTGHTHSHTLSGTLTGNITTSLTGTVTAAGTNSFSPFVVVNYIIKH
jgi:microcystin-dependent protein